MTFPRRLAATVTAAVLALAATAACTDDGDDWQDPAVAAYVADVEITEAELEAIADGLRAELGGQIERELERLAEDDDLGEDTLAAHEKRRFDELEQQVSVNRTRALEMRILTAAANRHAQEQGLPVPEPAIAHHAHELGLAEDNPYVRVVGEFYAVMGLLQSTLTPQQPSEADQREVYDVLVAKGLTTTSFEEAQQVLTGDLMGQQVALRNLLREALDGAQVRVRPDYDLLYQIPVPVGSGEAHLAVPLGGAD